jgi:hypothetical protein
MTCEGVRRIYEGVASGRSSSGSAPERHKVTKRRGLIDADGRAIQWLYCERKELPGSGDRAIDMATDGNMVVLPSICGAVGAAGFGGKESKVLGGRVSLSYRRGVRRVKKRAMPRE